MTLAVAIEAVEAWPPVVAGASDAASVGAAVRMARTALGQAEFYRPDLVSGKTTRFRQRKDQVIVYAVLNGWVEVSSRSLKATVTAEGLLVLGQAGGRDMRISPDADVVAIAFPQTALARAASQYFGAVQGYALPDMVLQGGPLTAFLLQMIGLVDGARPRAAFESRTAVGEALESLILISLIDGVAGSAGAQSLVPSPEVMPRPVKLATDHIKTNFQTECDMAALAMIAGVSARTLRRTFIDALGVSPSRYQILVRLERARGLIQNLHESRPLQAIAAAVGFGNYTSFWRAYCDVYGESPSDSRSAIFAAGRTRRPA